jgi:hypothetical protein
LIIVLLPRYLTGSAAVSRTAGFGGECLVYVHHDIIKMFKTGGDPDQTGQYSDGLAIGFTEL